MFQQVVSMSGFFDKLKKDKKLIAVMAVGLAGALILMFGGMKTEKTPSEEVTKEAETAAVSLDEAEKLLEEKLRTLISTVQGAGSVSVMVTVESAGEYVYAENKKSEGGSGASSDENEYVIYESSEGINSGLVLCIKSPKVTGVAVICDGGDSAVIKSEITGLVTSLFGIGANQVYVGKKS